MPIRRVSARGKWERQQGGIRLDEVHARQVLLQVLVQLGVFLDLQAEKRQGKSSRNYLYASLHHAVVRLRPTPEHERKEEVEAHTMVNHATAGHVIRGGEVDDSVPRHDEKEAIP